MHAPDNDFQEFHGGRVLQIHVGQQHVVARAQDADALQLACATRGGRVSGQGARTRQGEGGCAMRGV